MDRLHKEKQFYQNNFKKSLDINEVDSENDDSEN